METQSLKGRTAVVTGSTSGIGLGVAHALASQGADILLNGFGDKAQIDKLVAELKAQYKVKVGYSAADMSKPGDVAVMVAQATRELGRVDILVNNAGIQHTAPIEEFPVEKWDAVIAINLSAAFHAIRAALPQMKSRNWGRIVNIASAHGLVASTQKVAYVAAKHGLLGMTKVVALETATTGVTCNAICPGWVLTPLVQKQIEEKARDKKINLKEVPYKGGGPAGVALIAGEVQVGFVSILSAVPYMKAGRIRGIAVSTKERTPVLPEIPSLHESGVTGYDKPSWTGFLAPGGVPDAIINQIYGGVAKVLKNPDTVKALAVQGSVAVGNTPEEFGVFVRAELTEWARLIKEMKL